MLIPPENSRLTHVAILLTEVAHVGLVRNLDLHLETIHLCGVHLLYVIRHLFVVIGVDSSPDHLKVRKLLAVDRAELDKLHDGVTDLLVRTVKLVKEDSLDFVVSDSLRTNEIKVGLASVGVSLLLRDTDEVNPRVHRASGEILPVKASILKRLLDDGGLADAVLTDEHDVKAIFKSVSQGLFKVSHCFLCRLLSR